MIIHRHGPAPSPLIARVLDVRMPPAQTLKPNRRLTDLEVDAVVSMFRRMVATQRALAVQPA